MLLSDESILHELCTLSTFEQSVSEFKHRINNYNNLEKENNMLKRKNKILYERLFACKRDNINDKTKLKNIINKKEEEIEELLDTIDFYRDEEEY